MSTNNPTFERGYQIVQDASCLSPCKQKLQYLTLWLYNNWRFNGHRECEAERICFYWSQIPRAKQDQLELEPQKKMIF